MGGDRSGRDTEKKAYDRCNHTASQEGDMGVDV